MERMRAAGVPVRCIARKLGRSRAACSVAWSRYGPSPEYCKLQGLLRMLRRAVNQGLQLVNQEPEILERFGPKGGLFKHDAGRAVENRKGH